MIMILLGGPGAGKGTQAKNLVGLLGVPQISTGDMLRDAIRTGDENGKRVESYVDQGQLVPDEVIISVIRTRLAREDCEKGFILDGFPRTVVQAESLEGILVDMGRTLDNVLFLDVTPDVLVSRITGRRSCPECGQIFHLTFSPPPSPDTCKCGTKGLIQRADDNEVTVKDRLKAYNEQTAPLVEYYEKSGKLRRIVDSGLTQDEIFNRVREALGY